MLSHILAWISDRLAPASLPQDPEVFRRAKWVAAFDVAFLCWTVLFAAVYAALASARCGLLTSLAVLPILASLSSLSRGRSPALCGNLLCLGGWISLTSLAVVTGGSTAPALFWYTCLPFVAILTAGVRWGIAWTLLSFATIVAFAVIEALGVTLPQDVPAENARLLYFSVLTGLVFCHFVLASVRVGVELRVQDALDEANQRLVQARLTLATLEKSFDFSIAEWEKMKREKASRRIYKDLLEPTREMAHDALDDGPPDAEYLETEDPESSDDGLLRRRS